MLKNRLFYRSLTVAVAVALFGQGFVASAQESAYKDLNACTKNEQIKLTVKGAFTGALAGFGASMLAGKSDDAGKSAAIGAVAGGAIGFATAYYTAIATCQKLNPSWITESNIARDPSRSYAQVNQENNYKPRDGIKVLAKNIEMAGSVKAGTDLQINSTFDVMTPDGAETAIVVERKLIAIVDGKETPVPFPTRSSDDRVVAAGRNVDSVNLPIPPNAVAGTMYRVEFSVGSKGSTPASLSKSVTVI